MTHIKERTSSSKNPIGHVAFLGKALRAKPKKPLRLFLFILSFILSSGAIVLPELQIHKLKKKEKRHQMLLNKLKYQTIQAHCLGGASLPLSLVNIPFAEDSGLVVDVKTLKIRGVEAPYNPSLISSSSGYHLFFRYDLMNSKAKYAPFHSHIGVVSLNDQFEQTEQEFKKIPFTSNYTDDPRALWVGDKLYLSFNVLNEENIRCRNVAIAQVNPETFDIDYSTILDPNIKQVEKNWTPFAYSAEGKAPELFFEYQISPRAVFSLLDPRKNELGLLSIPSNISHFSLGWREKWGKIRGGTPAQKVGDEYLGFFHSAIEEKNGMFWYIMGAYTFQAEPPFAITGMSKCPIFFKGIFDTPIRNTGQQYKRIIFPSGFVVEKQQDRELIHVACGENDSGIKIVTLDKKILLKSLTRFEH